MILRSEVEKLRGELKLKSAEVHTFKWKYKNLQTEDERKSTAIRTIQRQYTKRVSQLKSQLAGAVRRINYLLEEKKYIAETSTKKEKYVSAIELELLRKNSQLKEVRRSISPLSKLKPLTERKMNELEYIDLEIDQELEATQKEVI